MKILNHRAVTVLAAATVIGLVGAGAAVADPPENSNANSKGGATGFVTLKPVASIATVEPGQTGKSTADCPEGKSAISGGYEIEGNDNDSPDLTIVRSQPAGEYVDGMFPSWEVEVFNGTNAVVTVQSAVVCAAVD